MSHPVPTDVLIIGAGPTGLALAADLLRRGVAVRLVDRAPAPSPYSRATSLTPRTLEVLDDLGALPEVLDTGIRITRSDAYQGAAPAFALAFPASDATRFPFLLNNSQRQTEQVLTALVQRLGGAVERGRGLVGVRQERDGVVALLDGPGGREEVAASWLVGADGGRSTVRRTLGVPFRGRGAGATEVGAEEVIVLGDVLLDRDLAPDRLHSWFSGDGALLAFPFTEPGRWRLTAALSPAEEASGRYTGASLERFTELYRRRTGDTRTTLSDLQGFSVYRVNQRVADHFRRGRVLLAGDAAHVHTPAGGLGMNTGIQDAYALGWRLAVALGGGPDAVVDGYERERRPVAEALLARTGGLQRLYSLRDPRAQRVRDTALRTLLGLAPVRRAALVRAGQLDVTYRTGRRLPGRRGPAVGDRAPDGPARRADGTPVRLHELLRGTGPVVLLLDGPGRTADARLAAAARAAASRDVPVVRIVRGAAAGSPDGPVLVDADGELHRRYGATAPTAAVVRPDGHLALLGAPDPAAVSAALRPLLPATGRPAPALAGRG